MSQNIYKKLKTQWDIAKAQIEIADIAFAVLRITVLAGGVAWLIFSDIPQKTIRDVSLLFTYFVIYCFFIYLWLFFSPQRKRTIYLFSLFLTFFLSH